MSKNTSKTERYSDRDFQQFVRLAAERGTEDGAAAAEYYELPPEAPGGAAELVAMLRGTGPGEWDDYGLPDGPLSMEWADGLSAEAVASDVGYECDGSDDCYAEGVSELADAYEDAYFAGFADALRARFAACCPDDCSGGVGLD